MSGSSNVSSSAGTAGNNNNANSDSASFIERLFNMDGNTDSTETAFLWLMVFGVIVMSAFIIYLLCRIFCYDFWAR